MKEYFESLSEEEIEAIRQRDEENHQAQAESFLAHYKKDTCYLCGKPFKSINQKNPCLHWLLRRCKFKKKDFPAVFESFSFVNIEAFLRWCANQERNVGNINDLREEKEQRKIISTTIKWKNIEWTFDCSENDYLGHKGTRIDFPHYHFQMRIDGKQFINFGDFHIPFTADDLFTIDMKNEQGDWFFHNYGGLGMGMQDTVDFGSDFLLDEMEPAEEEEGSHHLQTMIMANNGTISGDLLVECIEEQKRSGRTMAAIMQEKFEDSAAVTTIVSPSENVPEIAKRTERKRR